MDDYRDAMVVMAGNEIEMLRLQNQLLRTLVEDTAVAMESHDLKKTAEHLRKKLDEVIRASAS